MAVDAPGRRRFQSLGLDQRIAVLLRITRISKRLGGWERDPDRGCCATRLCEQDRAAYVEALHRLMLYVLLQDEEIK